MRHAWIALLAIAVIAAGCGQPAGPAPSANGGEGPAAAKGPLKIGVVPKGISHQFWLTVKAGAEAAG